MALLQRPDSPSTSTCTPSLCCPFWRGRQRGYYCHLPQLGPNHTVPECISDPWGSLLLLVLSPYSFFEGFQLKHRRWGLRSGLQRWKSSRLAVESSTGHVGRDEWSVSTETGLQRGDNQSEVRDLGAQRNRVQCSTASHFVWGLAALLADFL